METLLWIVFIVIIVGFLFRLIVPLLLKWFVKRSLNKMNQNEMYSSKKDGQTEILGKKPETFVPNDVGEYVDFENIDK